ncbi:MAG: hypothetical protein ACKE9I_01635 [Methylophagaceae bacterium]
MANKITATIEFYFKGEQFSPSAVLDLDKLMQHGSFPDIYSMLALQDNIDSYSYEYEMMLAEEVQFSDAEGSAADFFIDGIFDQAGFEQQCLENNMLTKLSPVIKQHLDIDDINQQQGLRTVLLAAWQLGKSD